jgi:hypothetical protein
VQCPSCHRELTDREPIHRVSLSWFHHDVCVLLVCRVCAIRIASKYRKWREPIVCEGCGRPVVHDVNRQPPRDAICSEQCCRTVQAAKARERRQSRLRLRVCMCGIEFKPTRPDARYCSSPCRQKAYRQRRHLAAS